MLRGSLVLATLLGAAKSQCPDCHFDPSKLLEFSTNWHLVQADYSEGAVTTAAVPDDFLTEHGSMSVHVRNLQIKFDNHLSFPTPFAIGPVPLSGMQMHEEVHVNGATGQASFHLASPVVNLCFQLDGHIPVAQMEHAAIEQHIQQAELQGPQIATQMFHQISLDGETDMGPDPRVLFTESSHPAFFAPPCERSDERMMSMMNPPPRVSCQHLGMKFDHFVNSVGNQFAVRACEIADHSASQSLLASSPDAREFVVGRIAENQKRLQTMLHPIGFNTSSNFLQLEIADLMAPAQPCTTGELAEMPSSTFSTLQVAAFVVCSFVMGVAFTSAVVRKTRATSADDYHQVVA
jgi:hypothetical protein